MEKKTYMKKLLRTVTVLALFGSAIVVVPNASAWNLGAQIAVSTFGGSGAEQPRRIKLDKDGNIYSAGFFTGVVDFDPGEGVENLTALVRDAYVLKLDPSGNYLWAKRFGGISYSNANEVTFDNSGNIYIAGNFSDTVDFDPGIGTAYLTSAKSEDAFILKLDPSGNYLWAKGFGASVESALYDGVAALAVDGGGNVYATGFFTGSVDFDPGTGSVELSAAGTNPEIFILKLDSRGNYVWAKGIGAAGDDKGNTIALDSSGNVYVGGVFSLTVDFDPSTGTAPLTSTNLQDAFILKLDTSGNYLWVKSFGAQGGTYETVRSMAVDGSGYIYATGYFTSTVDFDPGNGFAYLSAAGNTQDIFVLKLKVDGDYVWSRSMGSIAGNDGANGLAIDGIGNVYTTGGFAGTVDFDPGTGITNLISTLSTDDVFISKLSSNGDFVWARGFGGSGSDQGRFIAVDGSGNVYTTGHFKNSVDFDPGSRTVTLSAVGTNDDIFILKLDPSGNPPSVAVVTAGVVANSKVAAIPIGVTEAAIAKTNELPAIKLNFGGAVPTAVTVVPVASNPASQSATPFTISDSTKIVDITLTGSISGSVTLCLDGASTDRLYHYKESAWVELGSRSYVNGQVCGVTTSFSPFVAAPAIVPVYVAPTPVPYLKTLTSPKLNLKDGKLVCTPGTYNAGYTLDGVIQGSPTANFSPSSYAYNLLINGVAQTSKTVTSASTSTSWALQALTSGSLVACSVTVNANSLTNTDESSDNTAAISSALTTQSQAIKAAEATHSESVSANSKAYQKTLVDNRATWHKEIEAIQSGYNETLNRIKAKGGPKASSETSAALKLRIAASKKSTADYAASKPAALAAKDAANKAALDVKSAAIAKANLNYGTFIESIGYGVLIP